MIRAPMQGALSAVLLAISVASAAAQGLDQPRPAWEITLDSLQNAATRPAFAPDRRPPANAALGSPDLGLDATLLGTVTGPVSVATLRLAATGEIVRLRVGGSLRGWDVVQVARGKVTLRNKGDRRQVDLRLGAEPQVLR